MRTSFIKTGEQKNMVLVEDMRTWFLERHENKRTGFFGKTGEQENMRRSAKDCLSKTRTRGLVGLCPTLLSCGILT